MDEVSRPLLVYFIEDISTKSLRQTGPFSGTPVKKNQGLFTVRLLVLSPTPSFSHLSKHGVSDVPPEGLNRPTHLDRTFSWCSGKSNTNLSSTSTHLSSTRTPTVSSVLGVLWTRVTDSLSVREEVNRRRDPSLPMLSWVPRADGSFPSGFPNPRFRTFTKGFSDLNVACFGLSRAIWTGDRGPVASRNRPPGVQGRRPTCRPSTDWEEPHHTHWTYSRTP